MLFIGYSKSVFLYQSQLCHEREFSNKKARQSSSSYFESQTKYFFFCSLFFVPLFFHLLFLKLLMSQQIENKDPFVNDASRLPLRKRIGPVLKWQPVETPDDNFKPKAYPSPQQYPIFSSSEDIISDESHDTDEDKLRKQKEELKRSEKDELVPNRVS